MTITSTVRFSLEVVHSNLTVYCTSERMNNTRVVLKLELGRKTLFCKILDVHVAVLSGMGMMAVSAVTCFKGLSLL